MGENGDGNNVGGDDNNRSMSLNDRLDAARGMFESSPTECIPLLDSIQRDVQALGLFSKNETIDDISTKSIPFLATDHLLAAALGNIPPETGNMARRKENLQRSFTVWGYFFERLEVLEILSKEETKEFHGLLEVQQELESLETNVSVPSSLIAVDRDSKIARYKAKQQQRKEIEKLQSLIERRSRCGIAPEDEFDGHDLDSLERSMILKELHVFKLEALEYWAQSFRELPMIEQMIKMDEERKQRQKHTGNGDESVDPNRRPPPPPNKGLKVTHISQDAATGQLRFKREEIRSKVFQPGWNQPTMSLEELGEREYQEAIEREARQKQAEADRVHQPKKYEDLVRDGLEDNAELVDASAKLDRDWDDWKDQNPRGSGNKMANRGDKNF
uniref:TAP42-like protein n=1 Tax=Pseudo-nitzschia australis TaxID=44445 RepID=A0A7S4AX10_9STRA|mmetsp:Transcript_25656/g.56261  ORF Transcript_25656/g.56261 Transcript_25656/m.56261 type:complete len:388 (+) Transcript_25656:101-1264(+)